MSYYESIIQVRPFDEKIIYYIRKEAMYHKVGIAKMIHSKHGVDIYLTSNQFALAIGRKLKKRFNGTTKLSRKLYGIRRGTSKRAYRVTLCFRRN